MWGSILGGLASGFGSALGGLLGGGSNAEGGGSKKAKHHQLDYDRRRIKALVDGAGDAGIHPLAVLGAASGSGGFAAPVNSGSGWGVGDAIGAGLSSAADTFASLYESDQDRLEREQVRRDTFAQERRERAIETLRSKEMTPERKLALKNAELQNELLTLDVAQSRSKLAAARAAAIGGTVGGSGVGSVVTPFGATLELPRSTDAGTMQNEFGEVVGDTYGWLRWLETQLTDPRTGEGKARKWLRENVPPALSRIPAPGSMKPLWPN